MQNQFNNVVMIGLAYIGLSTAALIGKNKIQVHGVDLQQEFGVNRQLPVSTKADICKILIIK